MAEEKLKWDIPFNGRKGKWPFWPSKFLAYTSTQGYGNLLEGEVKLPSEEEYKLAKRAHSRNLSAKKVILRYESGCDACGDLFLFILTKKPEGRTAFLAIKNCVTDENPRGDQF